MTLKEFSKVNSATKTSYVVFKGENAVDWFTVNYSNHGENVDKEIALEKQGAIVKHVDVNSATGILQVSVDIKTRRGKR